MRFLLGWDFQPFPPPNVLDPVLAHIPSGLLQQNGDSLVAQPAILTGQCHDRLGERRDFGESHLDRCVRLHLEIHPEAHDSGSAISNLKEPS
jgi:hypothetical protein